LEGNNLYKIRKRKPDNDIINSIKTTSDDDSNSGYKTEEEKEKDNAVEVVEASSEVMKASDQVFEEVIEATNINEQIDVNKEEGQIQNQEIADKEIIDLEATKQSEGKKNVVDLFSDEDINNVFEGTNFKTDNKVVRLGNIENDVLKRIVGGKFNPLGEICYEIEWVNKNDDVNLVNSYYPAKILKTEYSEAIINFMEDKTKEKFINKVKKF
jgi:hypothetical protein